MPTGSYNENAYENTVRQVGGGGVARAPSPLQGAEEQ